MQSLALMAHDPLSILRDAMRRKGFDAQGLAKASGVHPSSISRYLSGKCEIGALNAHRLAPVLGVKWELLLGQQYDRAAG